MNIDASDVYKNVKEAILNSANYKVEYSYPLCYSVCS